MWKTLLLTPLLLAACSSPEAPVHKRTTTFQAARAWSDLETIVGFGPRPSGSAANEELRDFLMDELTAAGLTPQRETFTDSTPTGEVAFENIYADLAPFDPAGPWIILATHFDTKRLPGHFVGANDGGSGTAILLGLARAITTAGPREVGVRFLFLDGEEAVNLDWEGNDNTYGSRHHAAGLRARRETGRFGACVVLDMLGDKDLKILHETYSRRELMELFESEAERLGLGQYMSPRRWMPVKDDHVSFINIGIPSVDLIDFDYGPSNAYWHTDKDTLEHCSMESLDVAGRLVLGTLPALERWVRR